MPILRLEPSRAVLVLSALLAACGDDVGGDDATSSPTAPTLPATSTAATDTGPGPGTTQDAPTGGSVSMSATGSSAADEPTSPATLTGGPTTDTTGITSTEPIDTTSPDDTTATTAAGDSSSSEGGESSSTGAPVDLCKVQDDMDAMVPCTDEAPPNSFEPDVQWAWPGQDGDTQVAVTPVIVNLTDDNGDGAIDLCDIPDIVVPAYPGPSYLNFSGNLYVLDGATGTVHYKVANVGAVTYPAVADIDNDGSAEIVVVSNKGYANFTEPAIQVIRDKEDRWIPARRIWNQHAYHVTNVREDGTIPQVEPKSWELLNTFRTQAQIAVGGGVCQPEPQ